MAKLVTIFGGSGFLGRYIARRMAKDGWRIRVAVRRPNEALFVRPYGVVGQVEPVLCNIRDDDSVRAALRGADAAINCVGTFQARGRNGFDAMHVDGAGRIARIAAEEGVARMVHISALGADSEGASGYARSKAAGEAAVRAAFPSATVLRPSVMFGTEDQFLNRFAGMARMSPIIPVVGAGTQLQPVYVDDVARAAAMTADGTAPAGTYDLGGPDRDSFRGLLRRMLALINRRRAIIGLPFWLGRIMGGVFDLAQTVTGGLWHNRMLTRDQVRSLRSDSVVPEGAPGLAALGITPTPIEAVAEDYLWRFRPGGQFDEIRASARNLRHG